MTWRMKEAMDRSAHPVLGTASLGVGAALLLWLAFCPAELHGATVADTTKAVDVAAAPLDAVGAPRPVNLGEVQARLSTLARPWIVYRALNLSAVFRITVAADGTAARVELVDGCLPVSLKDDMVDAVRALRFEPDRVDGRPVPSVVVLPVEFKKTD